MAAYGLTHRTSSSAFANVANDGCAGRLTNVSVDTLQEPSPYVNVLDMKFTLDGMQRSWHAVVTDEAVVVMIYHAVRREFIMVRQFRAACWLASTPAERQACRGGFTLEMVAGLLDKPGKRAEEIGAAECMEEAGVRVDASALRPVGVYRSGMSAQAVHCFFVEVDDSHCVGPGGGLAEEGEAIDVVRLPLHDIASVAAGKPPGGECTSACESAMLRWFLLHHPDGHAVHQMPADRAAFRRGVAAGSLVALGGLLALSAIRGKF
jgi:UDP-sugar diphosphatase